MKKTSTFFIITLLILVIVLPHLSSAAGLVGCDGTPTNPCGFVEFMTLINKVINFILFDLAIPICALMFAYAGVIMVTSGGSTESRSRAKSIFTDALIGFAFAAAAWIIVKTLLTILGYKFTGLFF